MNFNIRTLDHKASCYEIYALFQLSYKIEAELAKAEKFPPLLWTPEDIQNKPGDFFGIFEGSELIASVQVFSSSDSEISIYSLVVHPTHFKKGLASALIAFVLSRYSQNTVYVETAAANVPAISLYKKYGFQIIKTYVAKLNIEKVRMVFHRN